MDKNYYLVGTMSGGKDEQLEDFRARNIWKLGWEGEEENSQYKKMKKIYEKISKEDILIAKSKEIRKGKGNARIYVKAVARVVGHEEDGHTLRVEWASKILDSTGRLEYQFNAAETIMKIETEFGQQIVEDFLFGEKLIKS